MQPVFPPLWIEAPGVALGDAASMPAALFDAQPVLFERGAAHSPLMAALAANSDPIAALAARMGEAEIAFTELPAAVDGRLYASPDGAPLPERRAPFSAFAERLRRPGIVYMHGEPVSRLPGLAAEAALVSPIPVERFHSINAWIGNGGQVADFHYDLDHNFICMLAGAKRVVLAPPQAMRALYPRALDRAPYGAAASSVRLLAGDDPARPLLREAASGFQVAAPRAGDVLYVPPYWWHHVESAGLNVMINMWARTMSAPEFAKIARARRRALFAFADANAEVRAAYRARYVSEVFNAEVDGGSTGGAHSTDSCHSNGALDALINETRAAFRDAPEAIRCGEAVFYDHWVFRTAGDPMAHEPGEFRRMIARLRARPEWSGGA